MKATERPEKHNLSLTYPAVSSRGGYLDRQSTVNLCPRPKGSRIL